MLDESLVVPAPVATVAPGDTVRYPDTWTHWGNEENFGLSFVDREPLRHRYPHGPYSIGPVAVARAEPGDAVEVSITGLRTISWGRNSFPLGVGALRHDFAEPYLHYFTFDDARTTATFTHGITLPMAQFLGVVAAEPAGDEIVSAIVSGSYPKFAPFLGTDLTLGPTPDTSIMGNRSYTRANFRYYAGVVQPGVYR
jgi:acetamidase/formamidase